MLRDLINEYVAEHRAMGYKYRTQNGLLQHYVTFAEQYGDTCVRSRTVLEWAGSAPSPLQRRNRLLTVRRFAIAVQSENPQNEVPSPDAFGHCVPERKIRMLFSSENVSLLLAAASNMQPEVDPDNVP